MKTTERILLILSAIGVIDALCAVMIALTEPCCPSIWQVLPNGIVLATPIWLAALCPWRDPKSLGLLAARWFAVLWLAVFSFIFAWFLVDSPKTFLRLFLDPLRQSSQTVEWRVMKFILGALPPVVAVTFVVEARRAWKHMIAFNNDPA